jgi:hypothetical protein
VKSELERCHQYPSNAENEARETGDASAFQFGEQRVFKERTPRKSPQRLMLLIIGRDQKLTLFAGVRHPSTVLFRQGYSMCLAFLEIIQKLNRPDSCICQAHLLEPVR